jgi:hypothetical protein
MVVGILIRRIERPMVEADATAETLLVTDSDAGDTDWTFTV